MHIVILLALILSMWLMPPQAPLVAPGVPMAAGLPGFLLVSAVLGWLSGRLMARPADGDSQPARRRMRLAGLAGAVTNAWLIAGSTGLIALGWGQFALVDLHMNPLPLVRDLVVMGPFLSALMIVWLMEYPAHLAIRRRLVERSALVGKIVPPPWTLGQYMGYNLRHQLLFLLVPIAMILLVRDTADLYISPHVSQEPAKTALSVAMLCWSLLVLTCAPVMVVRIWRTIPLPPGKLRTSLESISRRMRLRYRDIRLWRTGGLITNACVMGLVWPVRYVLLTDALIDQMDESQIEAIFAHEGGHIVERHIFYFLVFAAGTILLSDTVAGMLIDLAHTSDQTGEVGSFLALAAMWVFGFGWISRRFERQADVVAAWAVGSSGVIDHKDDCDFVQPTEPPAAVQGITLPPPTRPTDPAEGVISMEGAAIFSRALEQVALLNGIPFGQNNWRHGSISRRVEYILWLGSTGQGRHHMDRIIRRLKAALWLVLLLAFAARMMM